MSDSEVPSGLDVELRKRIQHWRDIVKVQPNAKARVAAMLDVIDESLAASGEGPGRAVVDAANDVRQSHAPNEWNTCVACRKTWPCDAELLAELVLTLAATAAPAAEEKGRTLATIRLALKGARGLALDHDETVLDDELARAIDLIDRMEPA